MENSQEKSIDDVLPELMVRIEQKANEVNKTIEVDNKGNIYVGGKPIEVEGNIQIIGGWKKDYHY